MLEVYRKEYNGKIGVEVTYYFFINVRGAKKYYEVVYEMISDVDHSYSRYDVELNQTLRNIEKIENDVYRYTPILFSTIKAQRRLAVLSKFVLYVISTVNNIAIYRIPKHVTYFHDGIELNLSSNAFVKGTYALVPLFEKIYKQS
jgi:hypothetical protein